MNPLNLLAAALLAAAPAAVPAPVPAAVRAAAPPQPVITLSQEQMSAVTGQTLSLESVITKPGDQAAIAHLNVTSLDGVYVDLEDWTQDVTQPVPPGPESQLDWEVQAVNSGRFAIYVVLIPTSGPLVVSPPMTVTVAARHTLDTGGAVPVALVVPALLGAAALATRVRSTR
jgi:hypothetical protein